MDEKERTVRSAMANWSRTARLCAINVVSSGLPTAIVTLLIIRH